MILLNKMVSRNIHVVLCCRNIVVNNVMHSQSLWRGRGNVNLFFLGERKKYHIVLDQSGRRIFNENDLLLIILNLQESPSYYKIQQRSNSWNKVGHFYLCHMFVCWCVLIIHRLVDLLTVT